MLYLVKVLISALIVVIVSEVAKRSPTYGGLIGSLPVVSLLALTWVYVETKDPSKVAGLATSTLWFVLPSLLFFLTLPLLLKLGRSFWISLALSLIATGLGYIVMAQVLKKYGVKL
jgi:hypothetical protein